MIEKKESKMILANSLISLMKKKPLERITVSDITKNSMMCRENFYYHFIDKYDLIRWIYEDQIYQKVSNYKEAASQEEMAEICTDWLKYFKENRDFVQNALKDHSPNGFHSCLINYTFKAISLRAQCSLRTDELSKEMLFHIYHYTYGKINIVEDWICRGMIESERFMAQMLWETIPDGLKKIYWVPEQLTS